MHSNQNRIQCLALFSVKVILTLLLVGLILVACTTPPQTTTPPALPTMARAFSPASAYGQAHPQIALPTRPMALTFSPPAAYGQAHPQMASTAGFPGSWLSTLRPVAAPPPLRSAAAEHSFGAPPPPQSFDLVGEPPLRSAAVPLRDAEHRFGARSPPQSFDLLGEQPFSFTNLMEDDDLLKQLGLS